MTLILIGDSMPPSYLISIILTITTIFVATKVATKDKDKLLLKGVALQGSY